MFDGYWLLHICDKTMFMTLSTLTYKFLDHLNMFIKWIMHIWVTMFTHFYTWKMYGCVTNLFIFHYVLWRTMFAQFCAWTMSFILVLFILIFIILFIFLFCPQFSIKFSCWMDISLHQISVHFFPFSSSKGSWFFDV